MYEIVLTWYIQFLVDVDCMNYLEYATNILSLNADLSFKIQILAC